MCLSQDYYWVQASYNQGPGTLTFKHWQALCLHQHVYPICLSGIDSFVVWLQSIFKIGNKDDVSGKLGTSLCTLYLHL